MQRSLQRAFLASLVALAASACAYRPTPTELIHIVDSPVDMRGCVRLGDVSPVVPTVPGFANATEAMLESTVVLGGTHLLLQKHSADWTLVRGIAYGCPPGYVRERVIVRAKG